MYVVLVHIHVRPGSIDAFKAETLENSRNSLLEEGVIRFDVLQEQEDPTRFVLVEVYGAPEDQRLHRETRHYLHWRDTVADMMAEPRLGIKYDTLFPATESRER